MLNHVETIFDGMVDMMKKLKKPSYKKNMESFREKNDHFFQEMAQYVVERENREEAVREVAEVFTSAVEENFSVRGRIRPRTQADLNFFMIYYVFPAILLTESEAADLIASGIRDTWRKKFKDSNIDYTDYDRLYNTFRDKILGIF
ncbi:hypothetical protein D7X88_10360 [bacterium C-53]|nr:hypothetical protein [Lachnospiraceae bacterium]NBI03439.1 hypothetical protein [Lachnospiraceae bacterium]RKJ09679.1 hypothetical protein D7X88_10360 [bacterium C-53]